MRYGVNQRLPRAADRTERAALSSPAPVQMRPTAARASRHDIASVPLAEVTQRKLNRTGLPDPLKAGIETLSGLSMDHVRVHYGSAEPARIGALAPAMSLPRPQSPVVQAYQIRKASKKTPKRELHSQLPEPRLLPGGKSTAAKITEVPQQTPARKADFRVANDFSMAVQDTTNEPKEFFAADEVFDNSNTTLKKAGSPVRLKKAGGQTIFNGIVLPRITPERAKDPDNREFTNLWSTICIEIANHVMGNRGSYTEDVVLESGKLKGSATINVGGKESPGINRLAKYMTNQGAKATNINSALSAIKPDKLNDRPGKSYGLATARGLRTKAKNLGVNEFARPEIGEGFATFSVPSQEKDNAPVDYTTGVAHRPENPDNIWGYHHAAVVAKSLDGADWMTLENYRRDDQVAGKIDQHILKKYEDATRAKRKDLKSKGKTEAEIQQALLNFLFNRQDVKRDSSALLEQSAALFPTMWFFRMYGSEPGQSFHEQQTASGAFVNPLTVRIRKNVVGLLDANEELISKSIEKKAVSWSPARVALNALEGDTKKAFAGMRAHYNGLKDRRTDNELTTAAQQVDTLYTTWLTNSFVPQMANALHAIKRGTLGAKPTTLNGLKAQANSSETQGTISGMASGVGDWLNDWNWFSGDASKDRLTSLTNLCAAINDVPEKVT